MKAEDPDGHPELYALRDLVLYSRRYFDGRQRQRLYEKRVDRCFRMK